MKTRRDLRRAKSLAHLRGQLRRLADERVHELVRARLVLEEERETVMRRVQDLAGAEAVSWLRRAERMTRELQDLAEAVEAARDRAQAAARSEKLARDWCDAIGRDVEAGDERRALEEIAERAAQRGDASLG